MLYIYFIGLAVSCLLPLGDGASFSEAPRVFQGNAACVRAVLGGTEKGPRGVWGVETVFQQERPAEQGDGYEFQQFGEQ